MVNHANQIPSGIGDTKNGVEPGKEKIEGNNAEKVSEKLANPEPDERLRKYGVLESNTYSPVACFEEFIKQDGQNQYTGYKDLLEEVKEENAEMEEQMQMNKEEAKIEQIVAEQIQGEMKPEDKKEASSEKKEEKADDVAEMNLEKDRQPIIKPESKGNVVNETEFVKPIKKNCERILAEYLCAMVKKVNDKFFTTLIIFSKLYKECMNEYGWEIIAKYRTVTEEDQKKPYSKTNNAEHIPEASNIFINRFLLKEFPNFEATIAMDLTMHLCDWLQHKGYTHTKISQI